MKTFIKRLEYYLSYTRIGVWVYSYPYKRVIEREIALGAINDEDTVLFVGGGAIPFTPIFLHALSGCKVIVLEKNCEAYERGKKVIDNMKLSHAITLIRSDGATPVEPHYTVLLTALQASPLSALLRIHGIPEGVRTIIRRPKGRYTDHYDPLPSAISIIDDVAHGFKAFGSSMLVNVSDD